MAFPVGIALILFLSNSLHLLAEGGLAGEVVFLLRTHIVEVLLVALVDHCRGRLEAVPDFLALLFGHRTRLAVLLMKLLKLMEGTDHVGLVGEFLSLFAEMRFLLQILLEVIFACLTVEVEQVVELLYVELIVAPELIGLIGRHSFNLFPFLLQGLEVVVALVGLLR